MSRSFLIGLIAIGVLLAGSVALVAWQTRGPGRPVDGTPALAVPAEPAPAPAPAVAIPAVPSPAAAERREELALRPPFPAPRPPRTAQATARPEPEPPPPPPVGRARGRRAAPIDLLAALRRLQPRLAECAPGAAALVSGPPSGAGRRRGPATPASSPGETVFVLELETLDGAVKIVDAPVEQQGTASSEAVRCAQDILRGLVVRTAAARAGDHVQISLPLALGSGAKPRE